MKKERKNLRKVAFIGLLLIGILAISGCISKPVAPSDLTREGDFVGPCTIEWNDNSNIEDGFNIYGGMLDYESTGWVKVGSVGKNVTSYSWSGPCCTDNPPIWPCAMLMVRAYNEKGESGDSNVVQGFWPC
jgi:hypothetical protein